MKAPQQTVNRAKTDSVTKFQDSLAAIFIDELKKGSEENKYKHGKNR